MEFSLMLDKIKGILYNISSREVTTGIFISILIWQGWQGIETCQGFSAPCHFCLEGNMNRYNYKGRNNPNWKGGKVKRYCLICNRKFMKRRNIVIKGNGKFCSRKCYYKYRKTLIGEKSHRWVEKISKECVHCGKIFYIIPSMNKQGRKLCSVECKLQYQTKEKTSNWRGGKISRICLVCNKIFYCDHSILDYKGGKYCSRQCAGLSRVKSQKKKCLICGTIFMARPAKLKKGQDRFCSRNCWGIYNAKHCKKRETSIEKKIEMELKLRNIVFTKQVPVEGVALVDFLLPNKIIVQCDGDYWHRRKENIIRDTNQDVVLGFRGYKVFRFWEKEINKSPKNCIDKIMDYING